MNKKESQNSSSKRLKGVVLALSSAKTVKVAVHRYVQDPKYKKYIKKIKKYLVHDPYERAKEGDKVIIAESRPISKRKNFTLVSILSSGSNDSGSAEKEVKEKEE